jgi:uncharacterized phage-associated protein
MYNVMLIAKYIINYEHKNNRYINNFRLQKILYFVQAQSLVNNNKCFDSDIEAWGIGTIIPEVYSYYKLWGLDIFEMNGSKEYLNFNIIRKRDKTLINKICDECSKYSMLELVHLTKKQTPWKKAFYYVYPHIIKNEDIKNFFKDK